MYAWTSHHPIKPTPALPVKPKDVLHSMLSSHNPLDQACLNESHWLSTRDSDIGPHTLPLWPHSGYLSVNVNVQQVIAMVTTELFVSHHQYITHSYDKNCSLLLHSHLRFICKLVLAFKSGLPFSKFSVRKKKGREKITIIHRHSTYACLCVLYWGHSSLVCRPGFHYIHCMSEVYVRTYVRGWDRVAVFVTHLIIINRVISIWVG